jgi:hypothetical protein
MVAPIGLEQLQARWLSACATPATGTVHLLVVREGDGRHATPAQVELSPRLGVHGDRWGQGEQPDLEGQLSLIDKRVLDVLVGGDRQWLHLPGDNIVVDLDLAHAALPEGARLRLGSAIVEISPKLHAGCAKFRARFGDDALRWVNTPAGRQQRLRGVFARIVEAGLVSLGDRIARLPPAP